MPPTWRGSAWPTATWCSVASRRGRIVLPAQRSAAQAPAQVFIAMHWGEELLSGRAPAPAGEAARVSPASTP